MSLVVFKLVSLHWRPESEFVSKQIWLCVPQEELLDPQSPNVSPGKNPQRLSQPDMFIALAFQAGSLVWG